jgi:hypothetical protein
MIIRRVGGQIPKIGIEADGDKLLIEYCCRDGGALCGNCAESGGPDLGLGSPGHIDALEEGPVFALLQDFRHRSLLGRRFLRHRYDGLHEISGSLGLFPKSLSDRFFG